LQEKNGLDHGSQYRNDKACKQFIDSTGEVEKERAKKEIESARCLCVLADGSTDKSVTGREAVYVRCTGSNGRPLTQFVDLVPVASADATGVTAAIQKGLQTVNIDESAMKKKLTCCNFDGASVKMGNKSGVAKRLQEILIWPVCIMTPPLGRGLVIPVFFFTLLFFFSWSLAPDHRLVKTILAGNLCSFNVYSPKFS